jgi:hypothetical protein
MLSQQQLTLQLGLIVRSISEGTTDDTTSVYAQSET